VGFQHTRVSGGDVHFSAANFCGGDVDFSAAKFSGGKVRFDGAKFSGGKVSLTAPSSSAPGRLPRRVFRRYRPSQVLRLRSRLQSPRRLVIPARIPLDRHGAPGVKLPTAED